MVQTPLNGTVLGVLTTVHAAREEHDGPRAAGPV